MIFAYSGPILLVLTIITSNTAEAQDLENLKKLLAIQQAQIASIERIPPGTVNAFAGVNVPKGWLPCDGREISQKAYARLFEALGLTMHGRGVGPGVQ